MSTHITKPKPTPRKVPIIPIQVPYRLLLKGLYRTEFQRTYKTDLPKRSLASRDKPIVQAPPLEYHGYDMIARRINYLRALRVIQGDIPIKKNVKANGHLVKCQIEDDIEFMNEGSFEKATKELRMVWECERDSVAKRKNPALHKQICDIKSAGDYWGIGYVYDDVYDDEPEDAKPKLGFYERLKKWVGF